MDGFRQRVGNGGQDGEGFKQSALWRLPSLP
jgi:hypothetical protein